jgi:glycosyltransferase involved in cell wall biosynthesis
VHVGYALLTLFPGRVGGSETNVRGLLGEYADGNGPERVTVLANRHVMAAYGEFARGPVALHHVASYRPGDSLPTRALAMAAARALPRLAARDVPAGLDVVHYPVTVPIPETNVPRVVTVFDVAHHDLPRAFPRAERAYRGWAYDGAARDADIAVTPSAFSAGRLAELAGVDRGRIEVVHMAIDHDLFTPDPDPAADTTLPPLPDRFVVYPANLWPHKNHDVLLDAFAQLDDPDLQLVLTGQPYGRLPRLRARAERLGIEARLHHLGHLPHAQVPALYRRARAMVFPSLYEGFGAPPLEAMACGLPVAASLRGSLPEVCGDAAHGFDPTSPSATAAAIAAVTADEPLRERLRAAGRERAGEFTWSAAAAAHRAIYERAAATSAASSSS